MAARFHARPVSASSASRHADRRGGDAAEGEAGARRPACAIEIDGERGGDRADVVQRRLATL